MRSIWKGAISFLLLSIPVKIYNAIETSEKISFNQLHSDCLGAVGYKKQCKKCSEVITNEQIVKGYQYEPDKYVLVTSEEISSIAPESNQSINIIGFITPEEIPTTYCDASYFASPDGAAAGKAYTLLRDAMKRTGKIAIAKVILREREELITISPNDEGLILQKLHYRHEVRTVESVPGVHALPETNDNELALAENLVSNMITTFGAIDTEDHYHTALKAMLDTKASGGTVIVNPETSKPAAPVNIMDALRASLSVTPKAATKPPTPETNTSAPPPATTLTLVQESTKAQTRKKKIA